MTSFHVFFPPIHHDPPTTLVTDVSSTGFSHYSSTQLDNSHSQSISPGSGSVLRTSIKYKISLKIMMLTILVLPSTKNVDSKINVNTWKVLSVQSLSIMKAEERARCSIFFQIIILFFVIFIILTIVMFMLTMIMTIKEGAGKQEGTPCWGDAVKGGEVKLRNTDNSR